MIANRIQLSCAVLLIISSIALAFLQTLTIDTIASGVLLYIAQAFMLAGAIFGLDYYVKKAAQLWNREASETTTH